VRFPCPDQDDALWERLQGKELLAGDQMLFARNAEFDRFRARGDQDMLRFERFAFDIQRGATGEPGAPVVRVDALAGEELLALLRHGIGKTAFEGHQIGPVDADVPGDALAGHAPGMVRSRCAADQHLLGIAAAQRAGAAEEAEVDHGHAPAGGARARCGDHRCRAGADDYQLVLLRHFISPMSLGKSYSALELRGWPSASQRSARKPAHRGRPRRS
jgi:hypothetical protein